MTETDLGLDRIERSIDIDASAEDVFALVQRPGWWINEGDVVPDPEIRHEDGYDVVTHPRYGEFRVRTLQREEPRFVAFHCAEEATPEVGTTVEFSIEDRPGGVTLRVVESGLSALHEDRAAVEQRFRQNTEGWEAELAAARRFVLGERA